MSNIEHPLPYASFESLGYWEGTGRDELVLQRCNKCQIVQHRPRGICVNCLDASNLEHFVASGKGTCRQSTVLPMMVATVIGKNIDISILRSILFDISLDLPFMEYHTTRKLVRPSSTWEKELAVVQTLEKGYEVK